MLGIVKINEIFLPNIRHDRKIYASSRRIHCYEV
jgi:hypothetical protein